MGKQRNKVQAPSIKAPVPSTSGTPAACRTCGTDFPSKKKMFDHLRVEGTECNRLAAAAGLNPAPKVCAPTSRCPAKHISNQAYSKILCVSEIGRQDAKSQNIYKVLLAYTNIFIRYPSFSIRSASPALRKLCI
jgi:hypothetical protein